MISKEKLEKLYESGLSMMEIGKEVGYSLSGVKYWMDKYNIPRRHRDEANYLKYNPQGDPFKIKRLNNKEDRELFNLGIGLFLGEGTKKSKFNIVFTNSDPQIIKLFLKFLRKICGVDERKIKAALNIFDDINIKEIINFWSKETNIPLSRFMKTNIRKSRGGTYKNKNQYGTLAIYVSNTKLKSIMDKWSKNILTKYSQAPE